MKEKNEKNNAGYMTVEAVLIFISILIILFLIIYSFFLLYQNIVLMNAATTSAERAAYLIASSQTEEVDISSIIDEELSKGFFNPNDTEKKIEQYGLLQPTVKVTLKYKISFPFRGLAESIINNDVMTFTVSSTSRVCDRPQYIRDINLIREIKERVINDISNFGWGILEKLITG